MKENAYLLNCSNGLCRAIKLTPVAQSELRRELIQALAELDYYRHGQLQTCEHCADIDDRAPGQDPQRQKPRSVHSLRDRVYALFNESRGLAESWTESKLHEMRDRADEMRMNPRVDASYRIAANMIFDACMLELEARDGKPELRKRV